MQLPLFLALSKFQGFLSHQIPLFDTYIYRKRGNPNFSSKWCGLETRPIRLPVVYHDAAIAYCQAILQGRIAANDPPIIQDPDPVPDPLTFEQLRELNEIRDLYGDIVADRIKAEMIRENDPPIPDQPDRPVTLSTGSSIAELDPRDILADPKRFQFKLVHNATSGSSGSLKGIRQWNEALSGLLLVWKDPKNDQVYVINGHNRLDLAQKLGVKRIAVRFVDCENDRQARLLGAIANIAEGNGTVLDAAKIFRDMSIGKDDLSNFGIKLTDKLADHGMAIANLEDHFFEMTMIGDLSENIAVAMGYLPIALQNDFYKLVKKHNGKKLSSDELKELSDIVKNSVSVESQQSSLFGDFFESENLVIEKSQLNAYILSRLKRDKYLFSIVSKQRNANDLSRGNNVLDTDASSQIADNARVAIDLFDKLKNLTGTVSQKINDAAIALHNGNNPNQVKTDLYQWVTEFLTSENSLKIA